MATLEDYHGSLNILRSPHLVGRSRASHTVVPQPDVSGQHAVFSFDGTSWTVRDLGSRNGTWVDGRLLEAGEDRVLAVGETLTFGAPEHAFTVRSVAPPAPCAVRGSTIFEGDDGLLSLPSPDEPSCVVVRDPAEGWIAMVDGRTSAVSDGATVEVDGQLWSLRLPEALVPTQERKASDHGIDQVAVHFRVSADDEYVVVELELGGVRKTLDPRTHHYTLLTLARARLEDASVPVAEQGWVYADSLMKMLRCSSNQLYVGIHRARKQVEALGVMGAHELIERRATTRQVRLGIERITVGPV